MLLRWRPAAPQPPALPHIYVRALDFDPALGYRETHASACTRQGLLPTAAYAPLGVTAARNATWDAAAVLRAIASLPGAPRAGDGAGGGLVSGCCSASLFCSAEGAPGAGNCSTHAMGGFAYSNVGWTVDDRLTPVYACALPAFNTSDAASLSALSSSLPRVSAVRVVNDTENYAGLRLQLDGVGLGNSTRGTQVYVGGSACSGVEVCSNQCRRCVNSASCGGDDKICLSFLHGAFCVRSCDWGEGPSGAPSCPCGGRCYGVKLPSGGLLSLCANKGILSVDSREMCLSGAWGPPPPDTDRL